MIELIPFKGVRYNLENIDDITKVVTPPYDVISKEKQQEYYDLNPYNIIRLELGKEFPNDTDNNNKYTRAAENFDKWLQCGIMKQEKEPSLYIYEQRFKIVETVYTRTGFIGLVKLQEFSKGNILPHENTLSKPKEDRLNLMRACNANFSQVFGLYEDEDSGVSKYIYEYKQKHIPDVSFESEDGVIESLWKLSDKLIIGNIQNKMANKKIFIADGHHRYETGLAYRDEQAAQNPNHTGKELYNYIMMMLVAMNDPGLVILPTHRCINNINNFDMANFLEDLKTHFYIHSFEFEGRSNNNKVDQIQSELKQAGQHSFALYGGNKSNFHILKLKNIKSIDNYIPDKKLSYKELDVTILHTLILENILGIDKEKLAKQENITYTHDMIEGLTWVEEGREQFAFFMNPTSIEQVKKVSLDGEKMPQKSTYFYPKLITGLVVNKM
ncbi:MAG TPA: DUF1015 domain-containing protein [Clostridiales bacterium]|nr:DUF1015 domain-containing protein [Clostridiales bacterium]